MENKSSFEIFAQINPGLEQILFQELSLLGIISEIETGGVVFKGLLKDIYLTNLFLKTPTRILIRICNFYETRLNNLTERISRYPWEIYINNKFKNLRIRTTSHKSKLIHSDAVSERILKGITKRLNRELSFENNDEHNPLIVVRVLNDRFTVSIDTSGFPLYKRGYKTHIVRAPLRENIASSIIYSSGWDGKSPLLDPFCGSGTIPLEALNIASKRVVSINRHFQFFNWKNFDKDVFNDVLVDLLSQKNNSFPPIFASDIDHFAIKALKENIRSIGYEGFIKYERRDFRSILPPVKKGYIITNPPFGVRFKDEKTIDVLYNDLIKLLMDKFRGWKVGILIPHTKIKLFEPLSFENRLSFLHGGIRVNFLFGEI